MVRSISWIPLREISKPAAPDSVQAPYQAVRQGSESPPNMASQRKSLQEDGPVETDPILEGLTLFEKKAHIVNRELDTMGRYQWMIFALCGFGYMLDLLWAQAFGLVVAPLKQELGFSESEVGNISSAFSAGLTAGAFVWGVLVDIIGRQWAFNCTVLIASIFGLCLGVPSNYDAILVLTAFVGFGVGGNIPIDTTITLEFLPQNRRFLLPLLSIFQPIGVVVCSALAYAFIPRYSCAPDLLSCRSDELAPGEPCCTKADNYGWRYLLFTLGAITMFVFFLRFVVFRFQESPKFLLYRGKDEKAVKVLQHIAQYNRTTTSITLETFAALSRNDSSMSTPLSNKPSPGAGAQQVKTTFGEKVKIEMERYKLLFKNATVTRLTILIWIIYIFDYWGFSIAGGLLPYILAEKSREAGLSAESTYRSYIYIYLFGLPGVVLGTTLYKGRQVAMLTSSALFAASLFIFTVVDTQAKYIGVNGLVYFFQSMFNAVLYGWTPEAYPAPIRGTAAGVASFWGRIASIVAPLVGQELLEPPYNAPLYLAGGGVFICTICIAFLPRKYLGAESF